jgi:hypothetical protein
MREAEAASVRRLLMTAVGLIAVAALVGLLVWWPGGEPDIDREALGFGDGVNATVTSSETGTAPAVGRNRQVRRRRALGPSA